LTAINQEVRLSDNLMDVNGPRDDSADTYLEANLHPAHKGAADPYCEIVGDCDGRYGSLPSRRMAGPD
jgi:hypothetical protein